MNTPEIKQKVKAKYGARAAKLEYLGKQGGNFVFGLIDRNEIKTVDEPFYIVATDAGEISEILMPIVEDDAYETSSFAALERVYKFYERNNIFDT